MKLEISIPNNGTQNGTVGDLVTGLKSGKYRFSEGNSKNGGKHGLWIDQIEDGKKTRSWLVAVYQQYDNVDFPIPGFENLYNLYFRDGYPQMFFTPAAWQAIESVGQQWCDDLNAKIESEEVPEIAMIRIA